jgi:ACS family tartrate transporter-like MFS transporter
MTGLQPTSNSAQAAAADLPNRTLRRVIWRLIPFLVLLYIIAFIDRVNLSYAKLQMNDELKFSDAVYGFGAGIFFIGYVLLEIPGTLLVERWSARLWISRIMITWGIIATLMGFMRTESGFYWLRFLLGLAEAGFYPGVIVYLTHWFPERQRGKAISLFMVGSPIASVIAAPLSGVIMEYVHWFGLSGWRWVFILEGIPAILIGMVTFFYLTDKPAGARWLAPDEAAWLEAEIQEERNRKAAVQHGNFWLALKEPVVFSLTAIYFAGMTGLYGFTMWLPTIVKKFSGLPTLQVTLLSAIPYAITLVLMLAVGRSSDRRNERIWHTALPLIAAGLAFVGSVATKDYVWISLAMLSLVGAGVWSFIPTFWTLPSTFLTGSAAAVAIGLINSFGNLGGFAGPYVVGYLSNKTHSTTSGIAVLAAALMVGGLLVFTLDRAKLSAYQRR